MLDDTLVVLDERVRPQPVVAEHDRPRSQSRRATPSWLAGGGIKGGVVHGATDEVGYKAVENRALLQRPARHDPATSWASTTRRWKCEALGRTMRLVEEGGGPDQQQIIA